MGWFYYEKNFANRWIPKFSASKPIDSAADSRGSQPVRSVPVEIPAAKKVTIKGLNRLIEDFPPPKDKADG